MEARKGADIASVIETEYVATVDARLTSQEAYIEYQMHEARRALPFLSRFLPHEDARVLEVGAGLGGKGIAYACSGIRMTSLDIDPAAVECAARAARQHHAPLSVLTADGTALPFPTEWFDAVLLDSVVEHVHDPAALLQECTRVLKRGGIVFVVFPPYYGPLSGHIDDFVLIPWFHLLPRRIVERKLLSKEETRGMLTPEGALKVYASLNRITVHRFKNLARRAGLHIEYMRVRPFITHPGTRLVIGLAAAIRQRPHREQLRATLGRAMREFDWRTGTLFVLLAALGPLAFVPYIQDIAAGGCKAVLRKA